VNVENGAVNGRTASAMRQRAKNLASTGGNLTLLQQVERQNGAASLLKRRCPFCGQFVLIPNSVAGEQSTQKYDYRCIIT
jgi:hypothetical protein